MCMWDRLLTAKMLKMKSEWLIWESLIIVGQEWKGKLRQNKKELLCTSLQDKKSINAITQDFHDVFPKNQVNNVVFWPQLSCEHFLQYYLKTKENDNFSTLKTINCMKMIPLFHADQKSNPNLPKSSCVQLGECYRLASIFRSKGVMSHQCHFILPQQQLLRSWVSNQG